MPFTSLLLFGQGFDQETIECRVLDFWRINYSKILWSAPCHADFGIIRIAPMVTVAPCLSAILQISDAKSILSHLGFRRQQHHQLRWIEQPVTKGSPTIDAPDRVLGVRQLAAALTSHQ
jgi:hypothetical protein